MFVCRLVKVKVFGKYVLWMGFPSVSSRRQGHSLRLSALPQAHQCYCCRLIFKPAVAWQELGCWPPELVFACLPIARAGVRSAL